MAAPASMTFDSRDRSRPGDVLRVESEMLEVRPWKYRPAQGLRKVKTTSFPQNGEAVQIYVGDLIVLRGPK